MLENKPDGGLHRAASGAQLFYREHSSAPKGRRKTRVKILHSLSSMPFTHRTDRPHTPKRVAITEAGKETSIKRTCRCWSLVRAAVEQDVRFLHSTERRKATESLQTYYYRFFAGTKTILCAQSPRCVAMHFPSLTLFTWCRRSCAEERCFQSIVGTHIVSCIQVEDRCKRDCVSLFKEAQVSSPDVYTVDCRWRNSRMVQHILFYVFQAAEDTFSAVSLLLWAHCVKAHTRHSGGPGAQLILSYNNSFLFIVYSGLWLHAPHVLAAGHPESLYSNHAAHSQPAKQMRRAEPWLSVAAATDPPKDKRHTAIG